MLNVLNLFPERIELSTVELKVFQVSADLTRIEAPENTLNHLPLLSKSIPLCER